ncbi:hypothetical protein [Nocardia alba]|uniref:Uncharacterized protein n=1 Tax=Nocardia alba TaxID=225051 RepID=A0A4R1F8L6_9NOCA|nr:hypothetical protein [Nocardia alba]TCJ89940.1 hypothetical protein DFR71_6230 [Nocardia alba]
MTVTSSPLRDILRRAHAINLAHILGNEDEVTALLVALHDRHGLDGVATAMRVIEVFDRVAAQADGMDPNDVTFAVVAS